MGFTFAGIHSEQHGLRVLDVKRPISPGIAAKTVKVPGKAGVYDMGNEVDALHISVEVLLTGQTLREIRDRVRAVAAWLRNDDQTGMLTFDDEPDKAYTARLTDQTELEEMPFAEGRIRKRFSIAAMTFALAPLETKRSTTSTDFSQCGQ